MSAELYSKYIELVFKGLVLQKEIDLLEDRLEFNLDTQNILWNRLSPEEIKKANHEISLYDEENED